jgi:hypothetical protein
MNKALLLEKYIKKAVRIALKEEEQQQKRVEKAMYFIHRFPGLKQTLVDLMSPAFGRYVADVSLVAPKPTTFNVSLINGQDFTLYYTGRNSFTVKVSGKKYSIVNIGESERASQAITDLLELNYAPKESEEEISSQRDASIKNDLEAGGSFPPSEPTGGTPPAPGTPPTPGTPPAPGTPPTPEEETTPEENPPA